MLILFFINKDKKSIYKIFAIGFSKDFDIFLSYSHKDETKAKEILKKFTEKDIRVFMSADEIEAGDKFSERILGSLRDVSEIWVLISPRSINSEWVMTEWGAAWVMEKRIVPILYEFEKDDLPQRLKIYHTIAVENVANEISKIKKRITKGYPREFWIHRGP